MHVYDLVTWLIPWEPSLVVTGVLLASAFLYLRGCGKKTPLVFQKICFWSGMVCFYVFLQSDFDYYAEHEFFMHRIQHSAVHHMAPFLIALSRPGKTLAAGLPDGWRLPLKKFRQSPSVAMMTTFINNPTVAVLLFVGLIIFWLVPQVHFVTMLDWRLYRLMNWVFVIDGLMFWNLVLNNYAIRPAHLSPSCRMIMMLAVIPPQIFIGALIFFAPRDLFPVYAMCGRIFGGIDALSDQQTGGLIIWLSAGMMSVLGIMTVIKREWLDRPTVRLVV